MTTSRKKLGLTLLVVLAIAVWLAIMIWITLQPERTEGSLGIDDEIDNGAAALTRVLEDHGISVQPAQSTTQLRSELDRNPDATVVFHDKYDAMQTASYERLTELAELVPADQRVFAGVSMPQQQYLLDGVEHTRPLFYEDLVTVEGHCQLDAAQEAGDISGIREGVVLTADAQGCFGVIDQATGEEEPAYAYAETAEGSIIFADWRMLSNAGLYNNGTATLALWSLGQSDTVIWFQPNFQFDPDTDGQLSPVQLPDWARMGLVWAVIVTGIFLLYRGRRTGPVVTEPLPAEVPAAETTVGRGRMYAKANQHGHALVTLQQSAIVRLARLLQLGPQASREAVLAETALQLGLSHDQVRALYAPPGEQLTSQQFVTWSQQLQDLETQVRHRYSAPTKESP